MPVATASTPSQSCIRWPGQMSTWTISGHSSSLGSSLQHESCLLTARYNRYLHPSPDTMLVFTAFDLMCMYNCLRHMSIVPHDLFEQAHTDFCRVACARYGGPIATIRDDRKMVLVSGGITQPLVQIYSSAGTQLAIFIWDKGRIEAMGWTNTEDLMIVEQTGEVSACSSE